MQISSVLSKEHKNSNMQNYNCAWCSILVWNVVFVMREKHRLRLFLNRVLRKIFGPTRDVLSGDWRRLHNNTHQNILLINSRRMRWAGHVALMGERRGASRVLVGRPEGKRALDVNGIIILAWIFKKWDGWGADWIDLPQDRDTWRAIIKTAMNHRVA